MAAGLGLQLAFGLVFVWGVVVPLVRAGEGWPPVLTGAVFAATPLGYGVGTLVGGRLAERTPPRRLCWAALGLLAAGFAVALGAPSGLTFVVCYGFAALGVGGGLALTGTVAALVRIFPSRAGAVGGGASAVYASAAVVQAPVVAALAASLGWLGALRAAGAGTAVLAAALLALMPALPAGRARAAHPASGARLLARPAVWSAWLIALCAATLGSFAAVDLPAEAVSRHLGGGLATAALVAFAAANAAGRLLAGVAADRIGAAAVLALVLVLDLVAGWRLFAGVGAATALAAALAAGAALGGGAGVLARVGADAAPETPNAAFGLLFTGYTAGALSGPILGGLVGVPAAWLVTAGPAAAGLALLALRQRLLVSAGAAGPGRAPRT